VIPHSLDMPSWGWHFLPLYSKSLRSVPRFGLHGLCHVTRNLVASPRL
jgi:hypothetical protein